MPLLEGLLLAADADTLTITGDAETYTAQVDRYADNQYTFYVRKEVAP